MGFRKPFVLSDFQIDLEVLEENPLAEGIPWKVGHQTCGSYITRSGSRAKIQKSESVSGST